jgi:carbonic anhydrase
MKTLVAVAFGVVATSSLVAASFADKSAGKSVPPAEAIQRLKEGNGRFEGDMAEKPRAHEARRREVAKGQHPFASVITCADSRLSPELIFDQGLGDLFVTRVAGNTFGKDILGSVEYSVAVLGSRLVVVLGHRKCGAVDAALGHSHNLPGSIPAVVAPIKPAVKLTTRVPKAQRLDATIVENVRVTMKRIPRESKIIGDMMKKGQLRVVGGVYDLETGAVTWVK